MSGSKINQAKQGTIDFAKEASEKGYATALAIFGSRAAMVCDLTVDVAKFMRKVDRLDVGLVGGTTNMGAGLALAAKFPHLNAVVVVTDGKPNDKRAALSAAEVLKKRGMDILCIGTDDADKRFLSKLASRSDLAIHVEPQELRTSIKDASRMLLGN
jgi:Mg-chelatase subunit ChlD